MKDLVTEAAKTPFAKHYQPLLQYSHCFIAYSGGLDSTVLLHSLSCFFTALQSENPDSVSIPQLTAIHINHQLHSDSAKWQEHCVTSCQQLSITLIAEKVLVQADGNGIESAARQARYQVFEQQLNSVQGSACLLMAHHANDQAETVLMRLSRGAGTSGAAGIPQARSLAKADLIRPLLAYSRSELEQYAIENQLAYIDDPSNSDESFDRNFIRRQVLPLLQQRWPAVVANLERFANIAASDKRLLSDLAEIDFATLDLSAEAFGESIAVETIKQFGTSRKNNILRFWLAQKQINNPSQAVIAQIEALINSNSSEAKVLLASDFAGQYRISIYRDRLYLLNNNKLEQAAESLNSALVWHTDQALTIKGLGQLTAKLLESNDAVMVQGQYTVGARYDGQKYRYQDMSRSIKKCFNEQGIPPWLRDCYPVVYSGDIVAAIPGILICDEFRQAGGWQLQWSWLD